MRFEIFVIQQSHIDIGYTERQEKITDYHAQFIAQAVKLALSDKQESRDPDTLFKFTCEGFWAVEQYLKKYGAEGRQKFIEAVRTGNVELSAFYLHLAELLDEGHLRDSISYAARFAKENALQLNVGMASDINGFSWGIADILAEAGVKYLITNLNSHHGGPPFGKPLVPFYWESPKGNKLLVWSGLAYHKANLLGLIPGYSPVSDPGIPGMMPDGSEGFIDVKDISFAEKRVYEMVEALKGQGYKYRFIPIMGSGVYTDNSPVTDSYCDLIRQWNEKHAEKIHIQTSTLEEFFRYLEKNASDIPTYRGDWNDWWTDGAISTPFEVKLFRNAQRTKRVVEMLDPRREVISPERLEEIAKKLILYSEHTWGHSSSYSDPWKFMVQQVDARKDRHAVDADVLACTALDEVLRSYGEGEFTNRRPFEYKVINPLDYVKKTVAYIPVDFWEVDVFKNGYRVTDASGNTYKAQHTHTLRGWVIAVGLELNPKEILELKLEPWKTSHTGQNDCRDIEQGVFENQWYRLEWNKNGIKSWLSKDTGKDIIGNYPEGLGEPVYQAFPDGKRSDAAGFGYTKRKKPESAITHGSLKSFKLVERGDIFTTLKAEYKVDGADSYHVFFTVYSGLSQIAVNVEMTKTIVMDPEGMYTAFPLSVPGGKWYIDKPGALILPGRDQLPGTCCDYYPVTHGAILAGDGEGIALTVLDAPMVTIGGIKLWDYTTSIDPAGVLYSWLCNNKWETNFKAECGGLYESRYILDYSSEFNTVEKALQRLKNNSYEALVIRK